LSLFVRKYGKFALSIIEGNIEMFIDRIKTETFYEYTCDREWV